MTRIGYAVTIALMGVSLVALIVCSVRQRRGGKDLSTRPAGSLKMTRWRGEPRMEVKCVEGEPVVFHTAEERFAVCKASMEIGAEQMEERGFDLRDKRHRAAAEAYYKKELAYILADQLLAAGAIRYERSENTLRAVLRASVPTGSVKE